MTLTKRDLVVRISEEIKKEQDLLDEAELKLDKTAHDGAGRKKSDRQKLGQQQILDVVQKALDYIVEALAKGDKVELRNFGVFEVKVRKGAGLAEIRTPRRPTCPFRSVPWSNSKLARKCALRSSSSLRIRPKKSRKNPPSPEGLNTRSRPPRNNRFCAGILSHPFYPCADGPFAWIPRFLSRASAAPGRLECRRTAIHF